MRRRLPVFFVTAILMIVGVLGGCGETAVEPSAPATPGRSPIPVLAYYYIWFTPQSWDRAKTDLPQLGAYSSDDPQVMRQHIRWAKQAGITGFIVSWKSTNTLNSRLKQLIDVADQEQFKLLVIYQGLDFDRNPLPVDRIAADIDVFLHDFAGDPAFDMFGQPVIIWSGTWKFSPEEVARVTTGRRDRVKILASQRNLDEYTSLADLVDGNAYYWSSVDPDTFPGYQEKLTTMSDAVHQKNGLWIAPAAAGFDARLIGGTRVIDRKDGATLRKQIEVANQSSPDAVGLISWNEFSENSHVEPSLNYGRRYLDVLADVQRSAPTVLDFDSDASAQTQMSLMPALPLIALGLVVVASLVILVVRRTKR